MKHIYKKLDKPTKKAQKDYQKYLGDMTSKIIRQNIPDFISPEYYSSNNYVRTGNTIVLTPDSTYFTLFPDDPAHIFVHHFHKPYLYLLEKI